MPPATELRLYNTLTKREEIFTSAQKGIVRMYTCGPTVYGRPHIGNYSAFLMADLLRRWLEVMGNQVTHVKNITDVGHLVADADAGEDKIEKQAKAEKTDPLAIARKYTEQYLADEKTLNMLEPAHRPKATETITEMIETIKTLIERGHAYETVDGVYFAVETFPAYGELSGNTLQNLSAGARIAVNEDKKHPADFALWKKCVGENAHHILRWPSPWGEGFPGWHIECSVMSTKFLGPQIDIHTGGEDNIFPHHECEIAQSECSSGKKPFVRFWLHKRRIDMGKEKMSKSLGNVLSIHDIITQGFHPLDLRYLFLSVHYRTQLKFTKKGLEDARKARRKIVEWITEAGDWDLQWRPVEGGNQWSQKFAAAMNADLNTPGALAVVFDCMAWSRNQSSLQDADRKQLQAFIALVRHTFGCFEPEAAGELPAAVRTLLTRRAETRAAKDFAASDRLRGEIIALGYDVKDTSDGQKVTKI